MGVRVGGCAVGAQVFTDAEREERVRAVAELLGLNVCLDSICGDATLRGISGGQMKRLSIGVEMVHLPSLLFLDEPTSGLDSVISLEVMTFVYKLACQQRTVISTIHQVSSPSLSLVCLCDWPLCLSGWLPSVPCLPPTSLCQESLTRLAAA